MCVASAFREVKKNYQYIAYALCMQSIPLDVNGQRSHKKVPVSWIRVRGFVRSTGIIHPCLFYYRKIHRGNRSTARFYIAIHVTWIDNLTLSRDPLRS